MQCNGYLQDTGATFEPARVHSDSLSWRESHRRELTSVVVLEREFHSGTKFCNGIM